MAAASAMFDQAVTFLDLPNPICYGKVRGAGLFSIQHEVADKTRYAAIVHGEGPWSAVNKCWVNRKVFDHTSNAIYHFHPGGDGVIGDGMAATSTGGDQKVDLFFASLPGALSLIGYSRYAYSFIKVAPDPGAPSADLEFLADFDALRCRQFDNVGVQTAFSFTENPAWWILDSVIRKFIKREQKLGKDWAEPLVTEEKNRIDFQSFYDASVYYDADIGGGIKRFGQGGVVFIADGMAYVQALEQKLLMCRSYLLEPNGKIALYPDKPRASIFTFTLDKILPGSFKADKSALRGAKNQIVSEFRDLTAATGDVAGETKFAVSSAEPLNHEAHQRATGVRGKGLSVIPRVEQLKLDVGNNTSERAWRIADHHLLRQLGDDADPGNIYIAPFRAEFTGVEESMKVEPGEVATIDKGVSEEFGGRDYEILEQEVQPDGSVNFRALEYMPNAFPDAAPTQQTLETPTPGTGLGPITLVDASGATILKPGKFTDANSGKVTSGQTIAIGATADTSGSWVLVATVDFSVPAGTSSLAVSLLAQVLNSGLVNLAVSGDNVGAAIHTGTGPASPQQSRVGTGAVTFINPVGNKLSLYLKGFSNLGGGTDIQVTATQDVTTPFRTGFVT